MECVLEDTQRSFYFFYIPKPAEGASVRKEKSVQFEPSLLNLLPDGLFRAINAFKGISSMRPTTTGRGIGTANIFFQGNFFVSPILQRLGASEEVK